MFLKCFKPDWHELNQCTWGLSCKVCGELIEISGWHDDIRRAAFCLVVSLTSSFLFEVFSKSRMAEWKCGGRGCYLICSIRGKNTLSYIKDKINSWKSACLQENNQQVKRHEQTQNVCFNPLTLPMKSRFECLYMYVSFMDTCLSYVK